MSSFGEPGTYTVQGAVHENSHESTPTDAAIGDFSPNEVLFEPRGAVDVGAGETWSSGSCEAKLFALHGAGLDFTAR